MKRRAYYNEIDPYCVEWLRNLIRAGALPDGEVDSRSIADVRVDDLRGFTECHFFAGIGGWALACTWANWPVDELIWTGSCPCQPYSAAGKQLGHADPRHLWPTWRPLIAAGRPAVVCGEQVAGAIRHGWLDLVLSDLAADAYTGGAVVLGAHSVEAPHQRQRLYWLAESDGDRRRQVRPDLRRGRGRSGTEGLGERPGDGGTLDQSDRLAESDEERRAGGAVSVPRGAASGAGADADGGGEVDRAERVADAQPQLHGRRALGARRRAESTDGGATGPGALRLGHPHRPRSQGRDLGRDGADQRAPRAGGVAGQAAPDLTPIDWADCDWLACRDGKLRPVEPGTFPLAHGVPQRVGRLRAYGNAIVPEVAARFLQAYLAARSRR